MTLQENCSQQIQGTNVIESPNASLVTVCSLCLVKTISCDVMHDLFQVNMKLRTPDLQKKVGKLMIRKRISFLGRLLFTFACLIARPPVVQACTNEAEKHFAVASITDIIACK